MPAHDSTRRFSDRVEHYIRSRPGYPEAVIAYVEMAAGVAPGEKTLVADVGSGTGISTELFLRRGYHVAGIEPNAEMRAAAERLLAAYPRFQSIAGTAEATTLSDHSVDLVVAGQAFHWFDQTAARREFARIAKPGGSVALLWNTLRVEATPFMRGYEALRVAFGTDYGTVRHENIEPVQLRAFFDTDSYQTQSFANAQRLDLDGLKRRLASSSYLPGDGDPRQPAMLAAAERLFAEHAEAGQVELQYDTEVHLGRVS